jgi:hypothetical protein
MKNNQNLDSIPENFPSGRYATNPARTYWLLLIISLTCMMALYGQSDTGKPSLPYHPALPGGLEIKETYRLQKSTYYVTPEEAGVENYDDLDKVTMKSRDADLRYYEATNSEGAALFIEKVLNPATYFVPQVIPHDIMILGPEFTYFYDEKGKLLATEAAPDDWLESIQEDRNNPSPGDGPSSGEMSMPPGWEAKGDGYFYSSREMDMYVQPGSGFITTEYRNPDGLWSYRSMEINDVSDPKRSVPIFRIVVLNTTLSSGKCVFRVENERYSEYYRAANDPKPGAGLRSSSESPVVASMEGVQMWPNPVHNILNLSLPYRTNSVEANVEIMNMTGQTAYNARLKMGNTSAIDLTSLSSGLYLIRIQSGKEIFVDKIIIP